MSFTAENHGGTKAVQARVTDQDVERFIVGKYFFTGADGVILTHAAKLADGKMTPEEAEVPLDHAAKLGLMTICVVVLANGFTVVGKAACAKPEIFNAELGRFFAYEDAKKQVWPFLGFELRSRLALVENAEVKTPTIDGPGVNTFVGTKVVHAIPMTRAAYNVLRGWELPADEDGTDDGYLVEYADGGQANHPDFAGYISWSPKAVFEQSYGPVLIRKDEA